MGRNKEEILKKAIKKAENSGYRFKEGNGYCGCPNMQYGIIFSHDFAKAFWGNEQVDNSGFRTICGPLETWQFHLQQLVLEEDPLNYIEKFL